MNRIALSPTRSASILLVLLSLGQLGAGWALIQGGMRVLPEIALGRMVPTRIMGIAHLAGAAVGMLAAWFLWRRRGPGVFLAIATLVIYLAATGWIEIASKGSLAGLGWGRNVLIAGCVGLFLWMGRREVG